MVTKSRARRTTADAELSLLDKIVLEGKMAIEPSQTAFASKLLGQFATQILDEGMKSGPDKGVVAMINERIAEIDRILTDQLKPILDHPDFQALEQSWRELHNAVFNAETGTRIKLHLLNRILESDAATDVQHYAYARRLLEEVASKIEEEAAEPYLTSSEGLVPRARDVGRYRDLDGFVDTVSRATPFELVELERRGVDGKFLKDLSRRMDVPQRDVFEMVGVPKATAEKKVASGEIISGSGGRAAIGMAKLIAKANEIVGNSTASEARDFDVPKWLGKWLQTPQPALGGRRPSELIDTPTGLEVVLKVMGAIESGAYQ